MGRAFEYRKAAKMKRWGNMSRVFPKLARAIEVAAKTGVPDPEMNSAVRSASVHFSVSFSAVQIAAGSDFCSQKQGSE